MTKRLEIYRCSVCGNLVQVFLEGQGELVCCGQPMEHLIPKNNDEMAEKHVPVFSKNENGDTVIKVGSAPHPMSEEHYITFVETLSEDKKRFTFEYLYPQNLPEVKTNINEGTALEYCNIHGLWTGHS